MLALRRSSHFEFGLCRSRSVCGEIFTTVQALRSFWQAVHRISPHKESFLVLRLKGTGRKLYPSPWRALPQPESSKGTGQQQGSSPSQKALS
ncbi:hypothetical protein NDU88_005752 [Pleurodeles waltl]|uniref:Uncharacterized protein n=1 Tax=Pleurodeles waltl TaxID=8319 RepID=A0AAV7X261_PLEWA|nr:hypothetical protein NDU88_005752 [Pleurodeles waltl]